MKPVPQPGAVVQDDLVRRAIEGGHGDAESKLDGVVVVPGLLVNVDRISFGLTKEIALGHGGRSYGSSGSSPMRTTGPS